MDLLNKLLRCFYPNKCLACKKVIGADIKLCDKCEKEYSPHPSSKLGDKYLISCAYSFYYEDKIKNTIWRFKFRNKLHYADQFTDYMLDCYNEYYFSSMIDYLVPVPMTEKKERERGYNQTVVLAEKLSSKCGVPWLRNGLVKVRETSNQHLSLTLADRRKNVKGAYAASDIIDFKNKNIIIIDDVLTTGLTMYECAKMLKKAGADSVYGITIAASGNKPLVKYR